jgi:hypothetical protein
MYVLRIVALVTIAIVVVLLVILFVTKSSGLKVRGTAE